MGTDNVELGPGDLYIDGVKVGEVQEIEPFESNTDALRDYIKENTKIVTRRKGGTVCFTVPLDKYLVARIIGLWDWLINNCPDRRVAHLIKYGKTERVRRKNYKRAKKIINKYIGVLFRNGRRMA